MIAAVISEDAALRARLGCTPSTAHISLILLVGAGRFERPTPCAQGSFEYATKIVCF
jgi:hypothetical protein